MNVLWVLLLAGGLILGITLVSVGASRHSVGLLVGSILVLILTLMLGIVLIVLGNKTETTNTTTVPVQETYFS